MNNICAPIKNVSTDSAVSFPSSVPILPNVRSLGGILEQVVPVGRSLVCILVCRLACHWGAGVLPAEVAR